MKFEQKLVTIDKVGDTRVVEKFLWFPKTLRVGTVSTRGFYMQTRWFERANVEQECIDNEVDHGHGPVVIGSTWVDVCWA